MNINITIEPPYSDNEIEQKLLEAMNLCFSYKPENISDSLDKKTSRKSKIQDKNENRMVIVFWDKQNGYIVKPTRRQKHDRGFATIKGKFIKLGKKPNQGELANAIKMSMNESKLF